jgi:hypothetical protein
VRRYDRPDEQGGCDDHSDVEAEPLQGLVPTFGAGALVNVTLDQTERSGFLTVYGPGENGEAPAISNINWYASGQIVANLVVTKLGGESTLAIKAGGGGRTHIIVDVLGYLV